MGLLYPGPGYEAIICFIHCKQSKLRNEAARVEVLTLFQNAIGYCHRLINPEEYEPVLTTAGKHTAAETTESTEPANDPRKLIPVYTYGSCN